MDSCWRCGQKLLTKGNFCFSCGAVLAPKSVAPPAPVVQEREAFDPLAATTPASAEQLAALRRGDSPAPESKDRFRGGTQPMKSVPGPAAGPPSPPPVVQLPSPSPSAPPRGVGPTMNDESSSPSPAESPTLRSAVPSAPVVSPRAVSHVAPPEAPSPPPLRIGARVLVAWADGNRDPATIQQLAPGQCLVLFVDGQHRWVDNQYVTPAPP